MFISFYVGLVGVARGVHRHVQVRLGVSRSFGECQKHRSGEVDVVGTYFEGSMLLRSKQDSGKSSLLCLLAQAVAGRGLICERLQVVQLFQAKQSEIGAIQTPVNSKPTIAKCLHGLLRETSNDVIGVGLSNHGGRSFFENGGINSM